MSQRRIFKFLKNNKNRMYKASEIAKCLNLCSTTVYLKLKKLRLFKEIRIIKFRHISYYYYEKKMFFQNCLLKKTKYRKLSHCKDGLDLDRYSGIEILNCLRKHKVKHCIDCLFYPKINRG